MTIFLSISLQDMPQINVFGIHVVGSPGRNFDCIKMVFAVEMPSHADCLNFVNSHNECRRWEITKSVSTT